MRVCLATCKRHEDECSGQRMYVACMMDMQTALPAPHTAATHASRLSAYGAGTKLRPWASTWYNVVVLPSPLRSFNTSSLPGLLFWARKVRGELRHYWIQREKGTAGFPRALLTLRPYMRCCKRRGSSTLQDGLLLASYCKIIQLKKNSSGVSVYAFSEHSSSSSAGQVFSGIRWPSIEVLAPLKELCERLYHGKHGVYAL
mmetsp:Transcript_8020/g.16596  ORF Transcript_8020/g.16596 Transcript_8020/m.16596 type:complete len:201 (-) Transcript_8020:150-752(-)